MATSFTSSSSALSLSLVLFCIGLSSARLTGKVTNNELTHICSKTENPTLCLRILKADPRSTTADLKGLGQVSIDLGLTKAKDTKNYIGSLIKPHGLLQEKFLSCLKNYENSIGNLQNANQDLRTDDYNGVKVQTSAATTETDECKQEFTFAPYSPSELTKKNQDFDFLCSIILVVSKSLLG